MSATVTIVAPDCPIEDVLAQMYAYRISCIVVCEGRVPVGLISERDITGVACNLATVRETRRLAREIMSAPLHTVSIRDSLPDAVAAAQRHGVRVLPVLDEAGELAGLVTQTDLFRGYSREMEELVAERTEALSEAQRRVAELDGRDRLLGVANCQAMQEALAQLDALSERYGRPYSLVLCDLDRFGSFDEQGDRSTGNRALVRVARRFQSLIRSADRVFRVADAQLLIALPETPQSVARDAAERLRSAVEELALPHPGAQKSLLTLSCGVAGAEGAESDASCVLKRAESALERAKRAGGNTVCVALED